MWILIIMQIYYHDGHIQTQEFNSLQNCMAAKKLIESHTANYKYYVAHCVKK